MIETCGPDNILAQVSKELAQGLSSMITYHFTMITYHSKQSLDTGELHLNEKINLLTYVTPIFKKDKRSDPSNYLSVSLKCKTFELILVSQIMNHLLETYQIAIMYVPTNLDSEQNTSVNHNYSSSYTTFPIT